MPARHVSVATSLWPVNSSISKRFGLVNINKLKRLTLCYLYIKYINREFIAPVLLNLPFVYRQDHEPRIIIFFGIIILDFASDSEAC